MSAPATQVARQTLPSSAKVWVLAVLSFLFFEFSSSSTVNGETTSETNIVIPFGLIFAVWCFFTIRGVARQARETGQPLPRAYRFAGVLSAVGVAWLVLFSLKEMVF